jgi:hypothetical protein
VQSFPETPACGDSPSLTGHLWIQELPTGGDLCFQLTESGALTFGTARQTARSITALPAPYRRGAHLVREQIDRAALQAAAADPTEITFFGATPRYEGIDYDWQAVPAFLGIDVWTATQERYLSPDAATSVFRRLDLPTLPAIAKEQPVAHTDLSKFTGEADPPGSAWGEGSVAGVLLRDKTGTRCEAWIDSRVEASGDPESTTAEEVACEYVTEGRISRTITRLEGAGEAPTVGTARDRIVADVAREHYADLYHDDDPVVSMDTFGSLVAERVQRVLAEE